MNNLPTIEQKKEIQSIVSKAKLLSLRNKNIKNGRVRNIDSYESLSLGSARKISGVSLCVDLVDSTRRMATSELDEQITILNIISSSLMKVITKRGGWIEKHTGDGVLAVFVKHGDSNNLVGALKRALLTARDIQWSFNNPIKEAFHTLGYQEINFRVGIDCGDMMITKLGLSQNSFLVSAGNPPNRASKVQNLAPRNGIAVTGHAANIIMDIKPLSNTFSYTEIDVEIGKWDWKLNGSPEKVYSVERKSPLI